MEIQPHFEKGGGKNLRANLIELSKKLEIPLVASNDVHYISKEDEDYHDTLLSIGTGNKISDPNRLTLKGMDLSFQSEEEMAGIFSDIPEAISNPQKIVDAVEFEFEFGNPQFPHFELPEGETAESYLKKLALSGFQKKFGIEAAKPIWLIIRSDHFGMALGKAAASQAAGDNFQRDHFGPFSQEFIFR